MKVVVCDFGLVETVPEGKTITRGGGTPSTWAPEVASKQPFNCSADWWSVGIVIYQLMYQRSPFDCPSEKEDDSIKDKKERKAELTKRMRDIYQARLKGDYVIQYEEENKDDIPINGFELNGKYSDDLKNLVKALLVRDPTKRLGYTKDSDEILDHVAFRLLTKVPGEDGSPDDKGEGFNFQKPKLFDLDQDFDKMKKEKDAAVAENDNDNLDQEELNQFADLFETDATAVNSVTDGTAVDGTQISETQAASQAEKN